MSHNSMNDCLMRLLALAVARGRSVAEWASESDVDLETAQQWSELPEFREQVDKYRLEHADRMVAKIGQRAERAIDRLVELSEINDKPSVSIRATEAILDQWIALTLHYVQEWKFQDLTLRVKAVAQKQKGQSSVASDDLPGGRTSPYPGPPIAGGARRAPVA
jgi:hypothetical protein